MSISNTKMYIGRLIDYKENYNVSENIFMK